uniref:Uncharacterized protein n=1 Tax=Lepeophtheirus salmonis TaxID=72036 RepID=A0A0K2UP24_LEPSM
MNNSNVSPGVVERASREISRRIQSLGFNSKRSKSTSSSDDVLNGNDGSSSEHLGEGGSSTEDSTAAIAKGSVMDKVNHVFSSNYEMGNANNKEKDSSGINIPKVDNVNSSHDL